MMFSPIHEEHRQSEQADTGDGNQVPAPVIPAGLTRIRLNHVITLLRPTERAEIHVHLLLSAESMARALLRGNETEVLGRLGSQRLNGDGTRAIDRDMNCPGPSAAHASLFFGGT